jgi:predicted histone-like DNA-binding protein
MAKYVLQELPGEMTDGKKIVYPKMQTYSLHDYETVIEHMHDYAGSFSEGMIKAVFDALVSVMKSWMPMGHNIKIDGLGVFSLSLGFDESSPSEKVAMENADDNQKTKYRHVCIKGINFKPDSKLLQALNKEATFERSDTDVQVPQKTKLSREERLARAKAIIEKNGFMTLYDYANATHQSRSVASKDLRQIVSDPTSGITTRGSHSHKVWIAKNEGV